MMTRFVLVGLVCLATLSAVNAAQNLSASRRLKFYSLERFLGVRSPSAKQMPNIMLPTTMDGTTRVRLTKRVKMICKECLSAKMIKCAPAVKHEHDYTVAIGGSDRE